MKTKISGSCIVSMPVMTVASLTGSNPNLEKVTGLKLFKGKKDLVPLYNLAGRLKRR